jgi:outer membrane lipoprotein carrier protein
MSHSIFRGRRSRLGAALAWAAGLIWAGATLPGPAGAEDLVRKLQETLRSLRSLEADFSQAYFSVTVARPLQEKGRVYFKKPDLMRWEYSEPERKVFLYDGRVFSQYYPEDEQLIRSSLSKTQYESEVLTLLSGQKNLGQDYEIEEDRSSPVAETAGRLKLTPRVEGEYALIVLDVSPRSGLITRAVFQDWAENRTEFVFTKIKENPALKDSLFSLKVPPGTEIIDQETPAPPVPVKKRGRPGL